ncbi:hypothetical protein [Bradyrhizobium sp. 2S1]|uniref:hypothetical protein n=1 Tax=Bradyrhizobium sp. 2S1 TaxID=1404429 RepID=UPI0030CC17C0
MSAETNLTTALSELDRARDIVEFSTAVVARDKQLRKADQLVFLQKAAVEFQSRFLPSFEESIRAERSWGYATTCNAVSRKAVSVTRGSRVPGLDLRGMLWIARSG